MSKREVRRFEWETIYANTGFRQFTVFPSAEGITVYGIDITERKRLQQKLEAYAKNLEKLVEADIKALVIGALSTLDVPDNVEARAYFDEELPKVRTDPIILKRVLLNLATNAIQSMQEVGKLTIHTSQNRHAEHIVITVKDTGVGIPEEIKSKIFTPLFTTKAKGQGFGLAVVKRLVEGLGGKVTFESEESKGTEFRIELPC